MFELSVPLACIVYAKAFMFSTEAGSIPGTRVRHELNGTQALVVGSPQNGARYQLVPVFLEGSTRRELWPLHHAVPLPIAEQCSALGGGFKPPAHYPLIGPK